MLLDALLYTHGTCESHPPQTLHGPCCPQWEKAAASIMETMRKFQGLPKYMDIFDSYVDAGKKKDTAAMTDMLTKIMKNVNVLHDADTCPELCEYCVTSELDLCHVTDSTTWRYRCYDSSIVALLSRSLTLYLC